MVLADHKLSSCWREAGGALGLTQAATSDAGNHC